MQARNYAIADKFRTKIYIPVIGIEIYGYSTAIALFAVNLVTISVLGTLLSFFIGSVSYYVATLLSFCGSMIAFSYIRQKNRNTGVNKLQEFYYMHIKRYQMIIDRNGQKHFVSARVKGVYYTYVC